MSFLESFPDPVCQPTSSTGCHFIRRPSTILTCRLFRDILSLICCHLVTLESEWLHYRKEKSLCGHKKATATCIRQVTTLIRSRCTLQYGGLLGSKRRRLEKGGDCFNKVTTYSGSTVYDHRQLPHANVII